jgi:hypothetical protein
VTADDSTRQVPTAEEVAQARAYMTGAMHGFGLYLEDWTGWADGTATTTDREGTRLIYTSDELHPFDAVIPCKRHVRHRVGVTWPQELDQARTDTAACSAKAPAPQPVTDPPTTPLRLAKTPTPLWLITKAAETPGEDRQQSAS